LEGVRRSQVTDALGVQGWPHGTRHVEGDPRKFVSKIGVAHVLVDVFGIASY
jgi:hypothetical protein